MKHLFIFLLLFLAGFSVLAQARQAVPQRIRQLMHEQTEAWNQGDLEGYMQPYWQSDSLMFIGKSGLTYGWQQTLDNYRRNYPDPEAMGKLTFEIVSIEPLADGEVYFVVGKWQLARAAGDLQGHYSLLWKEVNDHWVIVADHSS